ncbi:MAG: hypothetical protein ABL997_12655 [Planctomycetota bacterium]
MDLAIYAHPWDLRALRAHGGLARLSDLGFTSVALAVSYHAGRWLTPWQEGSAVRFLEDGTVHYRPQQDYGELQPLVSSEVRDGESSPLEWLCANAPLHGLRARAWAVVTHNTRLGELHLDACVQNAFGDAYSYSLCHADARVQRYAKAMVEDLRAHEGLATIELEAIASIGHRHGSHHDKNSFPADAFIDVLMSTCFCASCMRGMAELEFENAPLGMPRIASLRAAFRSRLQEWFQQDCMSAHGTKATQEQLGERLRAEFGQLASVALGHRSLAVSKMLTSMQPRRASDATICAQTNYDALRGNAALPFRTVGGLVHECAMTVYGEKASDVAPSLPHLLAATGNSETPPPSAAPRPSLRLCFHPRTPQYQTDDDLAMVKDHCKKNGIDGISVYHLGLLPWRTIERVAKVLRA